ncbi:MAG: hypothetical protein ACJ790_06125 [Myxococcaceae bacterium]
MFATLLAAVILTAAPPADAPLRSVVLTASTPKPPPDISPTLQNARKLAEDLRYEEAVVEYQRYLGEPVRPVKERARALMELGFLHLILGDEVNAQRRAIEALDLDPTLRAPASAPQKQQQFLDKVRDLMAERPRIEVDPRQADDPPDVLRVHYTDPKKRVRKLLLRHALAVNGPFYSTPLRCVQNECTTHIPAPEGGNDFTAWYYLEALDDQGNTLGQSASPGSPLQVTIAGLKPWYSSPWVWGIGGAAVIAAGAVFFIASAPSTTNR